MGPNAVEHRSAQSPAHPPTLAQYSCLLCKQRKVRCDRKVPCSSCVRWKAECVRTTRAPYTQRKRQRQSAETPEEPRTRSPERPAASSSPQRGAQRTPWQSNSAVEGRGGDQPQVPVFGGNLWTGLQEEFAEPQSSETPTTTEGQSGPATGDTPALTDPSGLLFGIAQAGDSLESCHHPQPVQTFVLWQAFLQNVNPLSKVIYAPQVQDLIVQAAADFSAVPVHAVPLLFALYAAAVASWSDAECQAKMGESKQPLLRRYLASTQRALAAAGFLRTTSLVLLQGYTIYLLAARQFFDADSMWILTGIGLRLGVRLMAAAPNAANGSGLFETEMRRRVFWQISLIDGRVTQLSGQKLHFPDAPAVPLPANLNDSDISPKMTAMPPPVYDRATEMLFCLMRYELGRFLLAHSKELHDPETPMARRDDLIDELAATYESKHLRHVDPALPLHRIATAGTRVALAKMRLTAHHPGHYADKGRGQSLGQSRSMPQAEHDMLFATSVTMVEALMRGLDDESLDPFRWHIDVYFQLDAAVFMLIESKSQPPEGPLVDTAWQLISDVFRHRPDLMCGTDELSKAVRQLVLRAWDARERAARERGLRLPAPTRLVEDLRAQPLEALVARPGGSPEASAAATGTETEAETELGSSLDCPADDFTSYTDAGRLGELEMTDWESWGYWNTLLQGLS